MSTNKIKKVYFNSISKTTDYSLIKKDNKEKKKDQKTNNSFDDLFKSELDKLKPKQK